MKLTEDHVLEPGFLHGLLHVPLRVVVGHEILCLLIGPERGHEHEPPHAGILRRGDEVACPPLHHALEFLGQAGQSATR